MIPGDGTMAKLRAVYDVNMKVMALIPLGTVLVELGRETYSGIPVPMTPDRKEGDGKRVESLLDAVPDPEVKKAMQKQLRGISRKHAVLSLWGDETQLMDAGSRNGVLVRGGGIGGADKKLAEGEKFPLRNGMIFTLGAWPLQFFDVPEDIEKLKNSTPRVYPMVDEPPLFQS